MADRDQHDRDNPDRDQRDRQDRRDQRNNGYQNEPRPPAEVSPIVPGRPGRPNYSLEALRERVEREFQEETAHRTDILLDLDTEEKRRAMLAEVADYVLAVEAITITAHDRRRLIDRAYGNLFAFGPLDTYVNDDTVTAIMVNGPGDIHIQRGLGKLEAARVTFDDAHHLEGVLTRVLATGGAVLPQDDPFLEVGVTLNRRMARLSLVAPPIAPQYSLDMRLQPRQPVTLTDLTTRFGVVPDPAARLLAAILSAGYGLLIVGDAGLGKTTLAGALAHMLPETEIICAVERAVEMHLPPFIIRHRVQPPGLGESGRTFGDEIQAALDEAPNWLVVDEIRGDEAAAIWEALKREDAPRYLWVFRGDSQADRLRSALGMVIRKSQPTVEPDAIYTALARHLPFVAALKLMDGTPRLQVSEWVYDAAQEPQLALCPLGAATESGAFQVTNRPTRALDLPDAFWT